ncbi:unnamed protein product [Sympodiomycopsis kandeliae]
MAHTESQSPPAYDEEQGASSKVLHEEVQAASVSPVDVFAGEDGVKGDVNFKNLSWPQAAVLVAKIQMGIGIIGIPATFSTLGFVPGLISLLTLSVICTYTGVCCGQIRLLHPEVHSPAELGTILFARSKILVELFSFFYWIFLVMISGSAFLTSSVALNAVSEHAICTLAYVGIVAGAAFIIGGGFRQLAGVAWLGWIGVASVLLSIWILVIAMLTKHYPMASLGQTGAVQRLAANSGASFAESITAVVTQLFALLGSMMFYGVSAEMKKPQDFTKAVLYGQGFVVINYILIGIIVYAKAGQFLDSPALGSAGLLFKKICYGFSLPAVIVSSIIFTHIATKFMFVRILRGTKHLTTSTPIHWATWLGSYVVVIALAFVLAAAIPIFDQLLSLIGSTAGSFFTLIIGGCTSLYILAYKIPTAAQRNKILQQENGFASSAASGHEKTTQKDQSSSPSPTEQHDISVGSLYNDDDALSNSWTTRSYQVAFTHPARTWKRQVHFAFAIFMIVVGCFFLVGATYGTIVSIIDAYNTGSIAGAFSCADNSNSS